MRSRCRQALASSAALLGGRFAARKNAASCTASDDAGETLEGKVRSLSANALRQSGRLSCERARFGAGPQATKPGLLAQCLARNRAAPRHPAEEGLLRKVPSRRGIASSRLDVYGTQGCGDCTRCE